MSRATRRGAAVAVPFYAVALFTEVAWIAIVPLAPTYAKRLSLSPVQTGIVLGAAGFATLVVSLPIGVVADRLGTRRITLAAGALVALSSFGQALAVDFWSLVVARAAFGVALGAIWTAGLAWIADAAPAREGPSALGVPVTVAGIGIMSGPAFAGVVAGSLGLRVPFLVLAGASTVALAWLALAGGVDSDFRHEPLVETLRGASRSRIVVASCLVMVLIGLVNGGTNFLAPRSLERHGLSAGDVGLVFSGSSLVFVVVSVLVTRSGPRAVTERVAGLAALLYGGSILLAVAGGSAALIIGFLLVRSPFWATLSTLSYPLGALGAARADLGRGAVMGLLNVVWGAASTIGPLLAAGIAQTAGERWAFFALVVLACATGAWLLTPGGPGARTARLALTRRPG